ncbi:MAG TPA: GNAT family N-acetyltransferase [Acetobacteraceae bacterium]|nr:GNAT family N-acetyltransferase [Acetobacteraceae bacterium]
MTLLPLIIAGPAHAAAMAALHEEGITGMPGAATWDAPAFAAHLRLPGKLGFIDPRGGMLLARVAGGEAEILALAVIPAMRRHGIGRRLVLAAGAAAAARGAGTMFLEVHVTNEAARALYGGAGFVAVGRRRTYYADGGDALVLRRTLEET